MIDDNKIKSAVQVYCDATYGTLYTDPFIAEGFRKGARWAINEFLKNLWHLANEIPEIGRVIIMENYYPDGRIEFPSCWRKSTSHNPIEGNTKKWLYVDDLLPKKGGGEQ